MASETVDPIDWSHPPPLWAVPPDLHVLLGVNAAYNRNTCCITGARTRADGHARQTHCQFGHSGYTTSWCRHSLMVQVHCQSWYRCTDRVGADAGAALAGAPVGTLHLRLAGVSHALGCVLLTEEE